MYITVIQAVNNQLFNLGKTDFLSAVENGTFLAERTKPESLERLESYDNFRIYESRTDPIPLVAADFIRL